LNEGEYALVLIAGKYQISWKTLRKHFGLSRLTMATPEEVLEVTGYQIGTVSPFGLKTPLPILADQNVFSQTAVSLGSGRSGTAIMMLTKDLRNAFSDLVIGKFALF
jgi:Cys-tRNA(Pro)/Cys-tRNA(Cys) deacylase